MARVITFDEMKELYEFSLSSNGLEASFDGPEKEIADDALAATYEIYQSLGPDAGDNQEREAALLAILAVLMVQVAITNHREEVDSLKS